MKVPGEPLLEVQRIKPKFWPVTPVIWYGWEEQLYLFSIPASKIGFGWTCTTLVAETEGQGAFP